MLTQPDRPAGRGLRAAPGAVKHLATQRGLAVYQPASLRQAAALERLAAARPEVLVVAAYGQLLPPAALAIAPHGAINIHASLLPRWRGAAPIQRALLTGDRESGISILQMDEGLDTGPILSRHPLAIASDDDAQTLHDKLAGLGATAIVAALDAVAAGRSAPSPQAQAGASYARKIAKQEAELDWRKSCVELERAVRALRPAPGARSYLHGEVVKIWSARCVARQGPPGVVLETGADGLLIGCGDGALRAQELQRAGGLRLGAAAFLRGLSIERGERFGAAR